jgi:hypothetical protein
MGPTSARCAFWGVRYQVSDVARSVAFYTQRLGFTLEQQLCLERSRFSPTSIAEWRGEEV